uniref:DUF5611 domain-containing protein n=1 Tax=uncultured marine group III euryarchaeote SAT1000-53-B3 TaxID=526695 RepID=B3V691_9ARCH|nr:hypothetical protein [uncultured marine group III euryarchaeote SAT1000-53-B3]
MNSFEIKRGHGKSLENGGLKSLMEDEFGEINEDGNLFSGSFKGITTIKVEFLSITEIQVETETELGASSEDTLAAHQAYNRFMENATSFTSKERTKRAKAKAKRDAKAAAEKELQS